MKKTKMITAIIVVLALTVFVGEAIGQPGGRGRGGGRGRWTAGEPQTEANLESEQPDNSWVPGPYCPFGQGPDQTIQGRQGRGPGGFGQGFQGPRGPYCPYCRRPIQNNQGWQGPSPGGFGQGFQGRGLGPRGQGFGRWDITVQRGPMAGRGGRGTAMMGRGGRAFQRRNIAAQGWGMNNWQDQSGPGGIGRPGPDMQQRWSAPEDTDQTNQPMPPRGRGWAPGYGPGWRQGWVPRWGQNWTPDWEPDLQPEKAPDANAPAEPVVEDQTEKPQVE